jgi:cell division protein FtsB
MILWIMARRNATILLGSLMARAVVPAGCALVILYFLNHALFGDAGLLTLDDIRARQEVLAAERVALDRRREQLDRHIALLDPRGADPDLADELVRRQLGVVRPDEVIVPLGPPEPTRPR